MLSLGSPSNGQFHCPSKVCVLPLDLLVLSKKRQGREMRGPDNDNQNQRATSQRNSRIRRKGAPCRPPPCFSRDLARNCPSDAYTQDVHSISGEEGKVCSPSPRVFGVNRPPGITKSFRGQTEIKRKSICAGWAKAGTNQQQKKKNDITWSIMV